MFVTTRHFDDVGVYFKIPRRCPGWTNVNLSLNPIDSTWILLCWPRFRLIHLPIGWQFSSSGRVVNARTCLKVFFASLKRIFPNCTRAWLRFLSGGRCWILLLNRALSKNFELTFLSQDSFYTKLINFRHRNEKRNYNAHHTVSKEVVGGGWTSTTCTIKLHCSISTMSTELLGEEWTSTTCTMKFIRNRNTC